MFVVLSIVIMMFFMFEKERRKKEIFRTRLEMFEIVCRCLSSYQS